MSDNFNPTPGFNSVPGPTNGHRPGTLAELESNGPGLGPGPTPGTPAQLQPPPRAGFAAGAGAGTGTGSAASNLFQPQTQHQTHPQPAPAPVVSINAALSRLRHLEAELNSVLIERSEAVRAALVALIAGQNMVLLGPPGCGKSLIVTELARRIQDNQPFPPATSPSSPTAPGADPGSRLTGIQMGETAGAGTGRAQGPFPATGETAAASATLAASAGLTGNGNSGGLKCFTLLMTKYTDPDEVFGPVSLSALKNDQRRRTITHRLPEAHFGFLDEVFKASSAVLNALLTIMNEREFDNGGASRLKLPLISLFGASNEMPEGRELEAFWDRFLFRLVVSPVSDAGFEKLINLLMSPARPAQARLSLTELQVLQRQVRQIAFTPSVKLAFVKLRKTLSARNITASDRRWTQCLVLLQAHALVEGRTAVEEDDLSILEHVLWNTPEQRSDIKKQIGQLANPVAAKAVEFFDQATNIHETALAAYKKANNDDERGRLIVEAVGKLKATLQNLINTCTPEHRLTLESGGRDGLKNVLAALNTTAQTRSLNKIENIIVQVSGMRDELVEHVS